MAITENRRARKFLAVALILIPMFFAGAGIENVAIIPFPQKAKAVQALNIKAACHTQGIAFFENYFYLSCVGKQEKKAWIYRVPREELGKNSAAAVQFEKLDVTEGDEYHPSGLDIHGACLWVAVAEYHPAPARSTFKCIDLKTFQPKPELAFTIDDHIGTIGAAENWIMGINWDAKIFYILDYSGRLKLQGANPGQASYQDCKHYQNNLVLCSGLAGKIPTKGYLDMLELNDSDSGSWKLIKRSMAANPKGKFLSVANEGMTFNGKDIYFVPDDLPGATIYEFEFLRFFD